MTIQTIDLSPGDTVSTIFNTTGLVFKVGLGPDSDGVLYWDNHQSKVGRLHWSKLALIDRGSETDVIRAQVILDAHNKQTTRMPGGEYE